MECMGIGRPDPMFRADEEEPLCSVESGLPFGLVPFLLVRASRSELC